MRPLIGVTTGSGPGRAGQRASIGAAYLNAIQGAGGIPVIIPPQFDGTALKQLLGEVDALVLTGGGDLTRLGMVKPVTRRRRASPRSETQWKRW
jgi:putative glutamine amidotransferase